MIWRFVTFFATVLTIVFGAHYFFYLSLINIFFWVAKYKRLIFWFFVFVSAGFITASLLSHYLDNQVTRVYYLLIFVWMAFFFHFFVVSIFLMALKTVFRNFDIRTLAVIVYTLSLLWSAYGINNALGLSVRQESVSLKNLPATWKGRVIVQISDVHLGQIHGAGKMEKIQKELDRIKPDIIFITGDLFDGMDGRLDFFEESLRKVRAPLGTYFVSGNHEYYLGLEKTRNILNKTGIIWLDHKLVEIDGVQILGEDFVFDGNSFKLDQSLKDISGFDSSKTNILLYHVPERIAEAAAAGVDLMLSGHTHRGQVFPFGFLTRKIFKGYDYGLENYDLMFINTSSGAGTWGPPMRTSAQAEIVEITLN